MKVIKIWLDDERDPEIWKMGETDWLWVKDVFSCVQNLMSNPNTIDELSLDHDLGTAFETGYDVLLALEDWASNGEWDWIPKKISIHTSNISAHQKMEAAVRSIERMRNK